MALVDSSIEAPGEVHLDAAGKEPTHRQHVVPRTNVKFGVPGRTRTDDLPLRRRRRISVTAPRSGARAKRVQLSGLAEAKMWSRSGDGLFGR